MTVKLERRRKTGYFVRAFTSQGEKQYVWSGIKNGRTDVKEVPDEVYEYLTMNSVCFDKGELAVFESDKTKKSNLEQSIGDQESYKQNSHTQKEIQDILNGHHMKMKSELNKITVDSEKDFVIDVAKDMADKLAKGKIDFLAEWYGVESDILFG
ncbi:hypothetical protein [Oceanobacillus oncorhynchi]|uniref:hypothetical protein n=1 Tax=Oceanobacillus oncorhynchi TaxID=545501 RepID=UPI0034D3E73B